MKPELSKSALIKIFLLLALLVAAPYLVPFTLEFIIVADLMGLEALIVFLLAYSRSLFTVLTSRLAEMRASVSRTMLLVAEAYMFKPRVYLGHASVSSLIVICAGSLLLACAVWLPVMVVSAQYIT